LKVDELANKETFLQLLVAQIKNQDPLQPTDGIQFVTQLAQFSQLEQLIGIKGDLEAMKPAATDTTTLP
jgi:flagellar basal-body rod modification protein FlgD